MARNRVVSEIEVRLAAEAMQEFVRTHGINTSINPNKGSIVINYEGLARAAITALRNGAQDEARTGSNHSPARGQ